MISRLIIWIKYLFFNVHKVYLNKSSINQTCRVLTCWMFGLGCCVVIKIKCINYRVAKNYSNKFYKTKLFFTNIFWLRKTFSGHRQSSNSPCFEVFQFFSILTRRWRILQRHVLNGLTLVATNGFNDISDVLTS